MKVTQTSFVQEGYVSVAADNCCVFSIFKGKKVTEWL
jgi:hypothetical protein